MQIFCQYTTYLNLYAVINPDALCVFNANQVKSGENIVNTYYKIVIYICFSCTDHRFVHDAEDCLIDWCSSTQSVQ